jgi:hypothetical protein
VENNSNLFEKLESAIQGPILEGAEFIHGSTDGKAQRILELEAR